MNKSLSNLNDQAPDLTLEQPDGTQVIKLGLIATLYFKEGYSLEKKNKIDECFARFYKEFEPHLKTMVYRRRKNLRETASRRHVKVLFKLIRTINSVGS